MQCISFYSIFEIKKSVNLLLMLVKLLGKNWKYDDFLSLLFIMLRFKHGKPLLSSNMICILNHQQNQIHLSF